MDPAPVTKTPSSSQRSCGSTRKPIASAALPVKVRAVWASPASANELRQTDVKLGVRGGSEFGAQGIYRLLELGGIELKEKIGVKARELVGDEIEVLLAAGSGHLLRIEQRSAEHRKEKDRGAHLVGFDEAVRIPVPSR